MPRLLCFSLLLACTVPLPAEQPPVDPPSGRDQRSEESFEWNQTRAIAATEATQAAAADELFLYAISNTHVARYNRDSGERMAVSTGAAKHLNSGFLWKGALYCAHSNFPRKPEQSEIKRLDLETMTLSTWHDFGESEGSLTWCIRRDDHWWCNFAFYGNANGRTYLARFDKSWREVDRWTYPPEVVGKLGRYSLSGGIFDGENLVVTGHDDRALFRLRIPESSGTLEFVGVERIPFTGQGIARDPVSGDLVGISRSRKQIVLAERRRIEDAAADRE